MTTNRDRLSAALRDHVRLAQEFQDECLDALEAAGEAMIAALEQGNSIFICGNGGSAADAQHFAAELVGSFILKDRRALPAMALTVDSSILTSVSNDFNFVQIFARQIEGLGRPGDVLVGISTSGRSQNVLEAFDKACAMGLTCIGLCGRDTSSFSPYCKHIVAVPHRETPRIQEMHIFTIHSWCDMIDRKFGKPPIQEPI